MEVIEFKSQARYRWAHNNDPDVVVTYERFKNKVIIYGGSGLRAMIDANLFWNILQRIFVLLIEELIVGGEIVISQNFSSRLIADV